MNPELLFSLAFPLAAPFWALMIVAPGWSVTRRVIASPLIVVPPALVYALAVLPELSTIFPAVANPTAVGVAALLGTPVGAAAGWAHFIAFDLFVGRWCYCDNYSRHPTPDNDSRQPAQDARERGVHPLVMAPVLVLTILLAPLGLLAYLVVRAVAHTRKPLPAA